MTDKKNPKKSRNTVTSKPFNEYPLPAFYACMDSISSQGNKPCFGRDVKHNAPCSGQKLWPLVYMYSSTFGHFGAVAAAVPDNIFLAYNVPGI